MAITRRRSFAKSRNVSSNVFERKVDADVEVRCPITGGRMYENGEKGEVMKNGEIKKENKKRGRRTFSLRRKCLAYVTVC